MTNILMVFILSSIAYDRLNRLFDRVIVHDDMIGNDS